ncbi:MAG: CotH kinase family protein [Oscillospiraceae bacterium]|nr:CotH kinase family protein [Oscillospiraceae bacterium]
MQSIRKIMSLVLILTLVLGAISATAITPAQLPTALGTGTFPSLHITSELHPFQQERELWHPGSISVTGGNPEWAINNADVQLRGRGNSTWRYEPKRPLRIRFPEARAIFGSEHAHREWILLANAFDAPMLRTSVAFALAREMGTMGFVPKTQFVQLYVNNQYVGLYQITDERDIGPGRGEITLDPDPTISEYWLEMDFRTRDFFRVNGFWYDIRFPSGSARTPGHIAYANDFITSVSTAILSRDWARINAVLDIPSILDYYILQELIKDFDVAASSMFMQIRGAGDMRRLYMGPVWDFDLTQGNDRMRCSVFRSPYGVWAGRQHYWFATLRQIPEFQTLIVERWNELSARAIPGIIQATADKAAQYRTEFERNFTVHSISAGRIPTWYGQANALIQWLNTRVAWLDNHFTHEGLNTPLPAFEDVSYGAWYYEVVQTVYERELMIGIMNGVFHPHEHISRSQMVTTLWRMAGEPYVPWSPVFHDVPSDAAEWFRTAAMWAASVGIARGDGTQHLRPHYRITRQEMTAMLFRTAQYMQGSELRLPPPTFWITTFADHDTISPWARNYVRWAAYTELMQGNRVAQLQPLRFATRAELATVLVRFQLLIER